MRQLIGGAMAFGLQGLMAAGVVLFAQSFWRDLAGLCTRKDLR